MKRGRKYTLYNSGWVCEGSKYIFRIDDEKLLEELLTSKFRGGFDKLIEKMLYDRSRPDNQTK